MQDPVRKNDHGRTQRAGTVRSLAILSRGSVDTGGVLMRICVAGLGYVGLANAMLLAQRHDVVALDINPARVEAVNQRWSPIADSEIERFFAEVPLTLSATTDPGTALPGARFIIVATPTNYDATLNEFDTSSIEAVLDQVEVLAPDSTVVLKSTVPVGYSARMRKAYPGLRILFSPEFLREGRALHDNLYPSRIIVSDPGEDAEEFATMLQECAHGPAPVLITHSTEAEAIKLFANTFLALRVAYFDELDSFAMQHNLDTRMLLQGVCMDPLIGSFYNNPSFGYGGYCLPKDSQQLLANYRDVPQNLIRAVVESNQTRQDVIAEDILARNPGVIGVHRLTMKTDSDNIRESSVQGVIRPLVSAGATVIIYEPMIRESSFMGAGVIGDLAEFTSRSGLILANRWSAELQPVAHKVYTRDIYQAD